MNVIINPVYSGLGNVNPVTWTARCFTPRQADKHWGPTVGLAYAPRPIQACSHRCWESQIQFSGLYMGVTAFQQHYVEHGGIRSNR
jgi:hypothetical protein